MSPKIAIAGLATVAVVGGGLAVTAGGGSANTITTTVADAGQLEVGNEVRAAGVRVGEIKSIKLVNGKAQMTLSVADGVLPIHTDATLTVRPVNVLGEDYVSLNPGSDSAPFARSSVIPENRTSVAVTVQDVLNTFHAPTAAGLASIVTALGEGLQGEGGQVAQALKLAIPALQNTQRLGQILSAQNKSLADLVATADPVAAGISGPNGQTIDSLMQSTHDILAALNNQQTAFDATLRELPSTLLSAQHTLTSLDATARQGAPVLHSLRPLTGNLASVVTELRRFADSADPALASLKPVLAKADSLLKAAAPVVAGLRPHGDDLARAASSLGPVSRQLLDVHLQDVMDFVRKWALSTNGRDGLSHYFRGVVYVTPTTLNEIAQSVIPPGLNLGGAALTKGGKSAGLLSGVKLGGVDLGNIKVPNLGSTLGGLLGGLLGGGKQPRATSPRSATDPTSALGLTAHQEQNLLGQLLGGAR